MKYYRQYSETNHYNSVFQIGKSAHSYSFLSFFRLPNCNIMRVINTTSYVFWSLVFDKLFYGGGRLFEIFDIAAIVMYLI